MWWDTFRLMMFRGLRTSAELSMTPNYPTTAEGDEDSAPTLLDGMATIILAKKKNLDVSSQWTVLVFFLPSVLAKRTKPTSTSQIVS